MSDQFILNKVMWLVDMSSRVEDRLPVKVQARIASGKYAEKIKMNIFSSDNILKLFFPVYRELIIERGDFRLDPIETKNKIEAMSRDDSYKLLWFTSMEESDVLGAIVIHLLDTQMRVAYRCFYHAKAKEFNLNELDYYAELKMQKYAMEMGYKWLCHGNDLQPVGQVGLSIYKFRVGARPALSSVAEKILISEKELSDVYKINKIVGYYSDPIDNFYTKFHLYSVGSEAVDVFMNIAEKSGVKVINESISDKWNI